MTAENKKQEALALREQGFSVSEISERMSISTRTVYRFLSGEKKAMNSDYVSQEYSSEYSTNDKIDNRLLILSRRGQSTKYKCLGVIAEYAGLSLTDKDHKKQAEKMFENARKRFYRRKQEFHVVPEFIAKANDPEAMLAHFYEQAESLFNHFEQAIESIVFCNYDQDNKTRLSFQIRYELSKALCLPHATFTERDRATARHESYNRVAELINCWNNGRHMSNTYAVENTKEQLELQQLIIEQEIEEKLNITKDDIPY